MADLKNDQDEKAIDDKVEDATEVDNFKKTPDDQADDDKPQAADEEVESKKKDHKKKVKPTNTDEKDDDESSEEEMLGLFDKDVLVEGKRERKKVSRLSTEIASPHPKPDAGLDFSQSAKSVKRSVRGTTGPVSAKERQAKHRANIKNNPVAYQLYLEKAREAKRKSRRLMELTATADEMAYMRHANKLRVRESRAKIRRAKLLSKHIVTSEDKATPKKKVKCKDQGTSMQRDTEMPFETLESKEKALEKALLSLPSSPRKRKYIVQLLVDNEKTVLPDGYSQRICIKDRCTTIGVSKASLANGETLLQCPGTEDNTDYNITIENNSKTKEFIKPLPYIWGKGTRLGDIEWVEYEIKRCASDELKPLHRLLYGRDGKMKEVKKNIRNFCGYPFTKQDALYKKKEEAVDRFTVPGIKRMCEIFAVKKGTRDEMMSAIIDFLMKPADTGKKIPPPKEKKSAKKKSSTNTKTDNKKVKSKENVDSDKEDGNEQDGDEEEDASTKKGKKTPVKKTPTKKKEVQSPKKAKSASKEKKPAKVKLPSKTKSPGKRKTEQSDDDDEPLIKKSKAASGPSDDEIKKSIHGILDGADLESITMKIVCKQVAENFPSHDLSPKKKFIKETVKEMIS